MRIPSPILLGICSSLAACQCCAGPMVEKGELSYILPKIEVVSEGRQDLPFDVRIFSLRENGECGEPSVSCPKQELYIAVSDNDELPVRSITFHFPKAYGWQIKSLAACEATTACVKLKVQEMQLDSGKWKTTDHYYQLTIDSIKEVSN